jgi:hypothetical protein
MWLWAAFILFIFLLVALDLGIFHHKTRTIAFKEALILSGVWISVALAFNVLIFFAYEHLGSGSISPGMSQTDARPRSYFSQVI